MNKQPTIHPTSHSAPTGISTSISFQHPFNRAGGRTSNVGITMKSVMTITCLMMGLAISVLSCSKPVGPRTADAVSGKCPRCGTIVEGGLVFWDGQDSSGKPVSGAEYRAKCLTCGASLFSRSEPDETNRKTTWQAVETLNTNQHKNANNTPEDIRR